MTAAEILRSAAPPADDGLIDKAIADLDVRIWEWADALKSAHTQLRSAFAVRATVRPSESLYESVPAGLSAAAAAAHVPSPPPMPAEWTAPPLVKDIPKDIPWGPSHGGHGASAGMPAAVPTPGWPDAPGAHAKSGESASGQGGVMAWPTAPAGGNWPEPTSSTTGGQAWPTWTPTDTTPATHAPPKKSARPPKPAKPIVEGPTPEERAQKAAAEEALLSELEEAIARRVRLLRRLDPDTPIEKLIEKAKQGQAEAAAAAPAREDKSSWWRRK